MFTKYITGILVTLFSDLVAVYISFFLIFVKIHQCLIRLLNILLLNKICHISVKSFETYRCAYTQRILFWQLNIFLILNCVLFVCLFVSPGVV